MASPVDGDTTSVTSRHIEYTSNVGKALSDLKIYFIELSNFIVNVNLRTPTALPLGAVLALGLTRPCIGPSVRNWGRVLRQCQMAKCQSDRKRSVHEGHAHSAAKYAIEVLYTCLRTEMHASSGIAMQATRKRCALDDSFGTLRLLMITQRIFRRRMTRKECSK